MAGTSTFRGPRAGLVLVAFAAVLAAQTKAFVNIQPNLQQFDQVHMSKIMLGDDLLAGGRAFKPQADPLDLVAHLPAVMPTRLAWEANGLPYAGAPPLVVDEGIFVFSSDRLLHSLDPKTGKELWYTRFKSDPVTQLIMGKGLLFGLENGSLVCVDPKKGKVMWTASLDLAKGGKLFEEEVAPISQPVLDGGKVYVGTFVQNGSRIGGKLYALDAATGQRLWERDLPHGVTQMPRVQGEVVWAGGGHHYGAYQTKDGQELKAFHLTEAPLGRAVGAGSRFFVTSGKVVYLVDADKQELTQIPAMSTGQGIGADHGCVVSTQTPMAALDSAVAGPGWTKDGTWVGPAVVRDNRVFALSSAKVLDVLTLGDGKPLAATALSGQPYYLRPVVLGNQAIVLEKLEKGFLLESFQGPSWRRTWGLTILDQLVTLPAFTAQGFLLWTQAGQLRMIN